MRQLNNFILEKLKINSQSKISNSNLDILDKEIEYLKDLKIIMEEYFKHFKIKVSNISTTNVSFKQPDLKSGILVKDHFEVQFFNGKGNMIKKLKFGLYGKQILMQLYLKDYLGKWYGNRIHGCSKINEFNIGDNFLEFLKRIKKFTDENNIFEKDIILINLFHLNKNEEL